jgi:hypothetical protein
MRSTGFIFLAHLRQVGFSGVTIRCIEDGSGYVSLRILLQMELAALPEQATKDRLTGGF